MKKLEGILSACMLFFIFIYISCTPKEALRKEGDVFMLDICVGDVKISHDEGKSWISPESGMILVENDMIKTGKDSYCDVIIPKRGIFRIADNTMVLLKSLKKELESIKVSRGKVVVNIFEPLKKDESFTVETTAAVVAVRGTEFSVKTDGVKTVTSVKKGKVVVRKNIEIKENDLISKEEAEKYLEVPISENEELETDVEDNKETEGKINKDIETIRDKAKLREAFSKISNESIRKVKRARVFEINRDFREIGDKQRQERIRREWERIQKEIERDKRYLNKRVEEIKEKAGHRRIADKKVSEEETTAEKDISDRVVDKKIEEIKKKREEYRKERVQKREKEESLKERLKSRIRDLKDKRNK